MSEGNIRCPVCGAVIAWEGEYPEDCLRCGAALPDPDCPSCHGHGSATIIAGGITVAGGLCRCVGGHTWAVPVREEV